MIVDGGGKSYFNEIIINVTDVNDHPPKFTLTRYTTNIYPNTTIATKILQVINGKITFTKWKFSTSLWFQFFYNIPAIIRNVYTRLAT